MPDRVAVIGGGIAGVATALQLDAAGLEVVLLVQAPLGTEASTPWAQGGIAAAIGMDDSPALHAADTLAAGAGLSEPAVAHRVAAAAPACIERLIDWGVAFDRDGGALALGLEAAHGRHRIVHAGGDATGRVVLEALIRRLRGAANVDIFEGMRAVGLACAGDRVIGVEALSEGGRVLLPCRAVVLATGGIGGLYAHTTNPLGAAGSGLAMAARAGAVLRDLEFVQFHPTAMALPGRDPLPLATEALRGEGAVLVNGRGERFMADIPGAELAPRDVVARAIWRQIAAGEPVFLDGRQAIGDRFPRRFPQVTALCRQAGIDPATQPIPVRPAAHYHMGGVAVDEHGRSSVRGLWACGEVASTGLHGANRLASNSLLEALAYADWIAADIAGQTAIRFIPADQPRQGAVAPAVPSGELRQLMERAVGVVRDRAGLTAAIERLAAMEGEAASVGLLIAVAALRRDESRGGHFRADHPMPAGGTARSATLTLAEAQGLATLPSSLRSSVGSS